MFSSSTLWFNFWHYIFPSPLFLEISSEFCLSEVILLTPDSLSYPGLWYSYTHPHPNAWPSPSMAPSPHTRFSVLPLHDFSFRRLSVLNRANVSELLVPLPKKRPDHHICLLRYLYASQEATVRMGHGTKDWFQIGKWGCQGCIILSLYLFNLYAGYIMQNARLNEAQAGIKIGGRNSNNLS